MNRRSPRTVAALAFSLTPLLRSALVLRTLAGAALFGLLIPALHAGDWLRALPGWRYEFPRDHFRHADFKTEWWYFTGQLRAENGRRFGYQLTFFRQGLRPPGERTPVRSRFVVEDLKFAHFAMTDVAERGFHFEQKLQRGAFGEAGFAATNDSAESRLAWIDDWQLKLRADGTWDLAARGARHALSLHLTTAKPWIFHGENGASQKAAGDGNASHYYSGTRMPSRGEVRIDGRTFAVNGESWLDREWATNQLGPDQVGWDWFSLQLDDGTELMLYQMRLRDGGSDPFSSGTFVARDGTTRHLRRGDYQLTPTKFWTSKATGGRYPIAWELAVPALELRLTVTTPVQNQELVLQPIAYWEGLIDAAGTRAGQRLRAHGYLELTGYAGELVGLSATSR